MSVNVRHYDEARFAADAFPAVSVSHEEDLAFLRPFAAIAEREDLGNLTVSNANPATGDGDFYVAGISGASAKLCLAEIDPEVAAPFVGIMEHACRYGLNLTFCHEAEFSSRQATVEGPSDEIEMNLSQGTAGAMVESLGFRFDADCSNMYPAREIALRCATRGEALFERLGMVADYALRASGPEPPALAAFGRCSVTSVVGYADAGSTHANRFGKPSNRKPKTLQVHRLGGRRR